MCNVAVHSCVLFFNPSVLRVELRGGQNIVKVYQVLKGSILRVLFLLCIEEACEKVQGVGVIR